MTKFDPQSTDAQFATIITRMGVQDEKLELIPKILEQTNRTNGRVTRLELIMGMIIFAVMTIFTAVVMHYIK